MNKWMDDLKKKASKENDINNKYKQHKSVQ